MIGATIFFPSVTPAIFSRCRSLSWNLTNEQVSSDPVGMSDPERGFDFLLPTSDAFDFIATSTNGDLRSAIPSRSRPLKEE